MEENIGKIRLDYSHYPGEDSYCDGEIEDEILRIVKEEKPQDYYRIIEEKASWPILYHLSGLRGNIVDWLPITKEMKVLEVGSGCGAITGTLANKAGSVTCIDLSKKRSYINAYRNREYDNITIHVGNFADIEKSLACDYDRIILIGAFEYGQGYIDSHTPYEDFMKILYRHLAPQGNLVIAIENKFGLKYWAGCKEDHYGTYFAGMEDYPDQGIARTFTRKGLEKILKACHISEYSFYYPYPDYKFMTCLYSDNRLPKVGELSTNTNNFDRERLVLMDEARTFDCVIREEEFPHYANSFLLLIGKECPVQYSKFSNDRDEQYCIRTDIRKQEDKVVVVKTPLTKKAKSHISHIGNACELLTKRYEGSGLKVNQCSLKDGSAYFPFEEGRSLEELLDQCLDEGREDNFMSLLNRYELLVSFGEDSGVSDYDLIFSNILVQGEEWVIIDYEWTYEEKIPVKELLFRALFCYSHGFEKRKEIAFRLIHDLLGYGEKELEALAEKEALFQKKVTGHKPAMSDYYYLIGRPLVPVSQLASQFLLSKERNRVQIYEDKGSGFCEETSYFLKNALINENKIAFVQKIMEQTRAVRIDPSLDYCMVQIKRLLWDGKPIDPIGESVTTNGFTIAGNVILFATKDPNITVLLPGRKKAYLEAELSIVSLPESMGNLIAKDPQNLFSGSAAKKDPASRRKGLLKGRIF